MKTRSRFVSMLIVALAVTACDTGKKDDNNLLLMLLAMGPTAGDKKTYAADGVNFTIVYVPGGKTFPTGVSDDGDIDGDNVPDIEFAVTVANAYWIGETEVTYALWSTVYTWATDAARGANQYTFAVDNPGVQGDGVGDTPQHPVTTINWRSAIVWCNALTEWCNARTGTSYSCVYYSDASYTTPIRDSSDGTYGSSINLDNGGFDKPYIKAAESGNFFMDACTATGFRLLTANEWELAARYRNGKIWTYGDHVSGDDSGYCFDDGTPLGDMPLSTVFDEYAVYNGNAGSSTAVVKSLGKDSDNALGLFDMSGNVWEWCFDWHPAWVDSARGARGGSWFHLPYYLRVGLWNNDNPYHEYNFLGFRFARNR